MIVVPEPQGETDEASIHRIGFDRRGGADLPCVGRLWRNGARRHGDRTGQFACPRSHGHRRDPTALCRALDDSDMDAYLATLTDDAQFLSAEGNYSGKDAIRAYVEPVMKSRIARRESEGAAATATHHVVTNQALEFLDADNAVVRAYWMFVV